jgi:chemosensory pili system protein ChpB (putative protein-glutamate methylesterase)
MAEKLSGQKIRAALVFQAVQLGQHLRTALAEAGIDVVAESTAKSLAASGFDATLDVFVVNLDPELEDHLDEVSDLLDRYERPVIFNDGAASSGLAGWDQARWARHLASKIRGELDSHPPRPIDATYIPDQPKPKAKPAPSPTVATVLAPSKPLSATMELPKFELPVQASANFDNAPDALIADFDLPELPNSAAETFDLKDADFGWDELDALAPDPIAAVTSPVVEADFFDLPDFELALEPEVEAPDEFETLLRSQKNESILAPIAPVVAAKALDVSAADTSDADSLKSAPMEWSLEPLDSEDFAAPVAPTSGRASFVVKDVAVKDAALPIGAKPEAKPVAETLDALDELADLDFFADMPQSREASPSNAPYVQNQSQDPIAPQSAQSLDQLFADLDDISFDASEPLPSSAASSGVSESTSFVDDFDFDMDVEAPAPTQSNALQSSSKDASSSDIADFDSLFSTSASPEAHAGFASSTGPAKVYVLGASIGGPEAVKTFLSKLKPGISAAFVLAQHMGAEFLELMAGQLSKSSALPVKLAQEGVLLRESEVVVVPVNKRFMIDAAGNVEFQENFDESPYSPSIDQVMSDMSDRFGNRCVGIIFSGMASDAIEGSKVIASRGGKVWVQDPATCVISSMIDGAQAAGVVSYVGAPEQLADHVLEDLGMR